MIVVRVVVALLAVAGAAGVLASVLRTVVLPRAMPARLARLSFLAVRATLRLRLRLTRRRDYEMRDRVFALQAPLGLFAQPFTWSLLIFLGFAALFWTMSSNTLSGPAAIRAPELSGSSMLTLGVDKPRGLLRHLAAFATPGAA